MDAVSMAVYSPSITCFPQLILPHRCSLLLHFSPDILKREGAGKGELQLRVPLGSSHHTAASLLPSLTHKGQRKNVKAETELLGCGHQDHMETSVSSLGISLGNLVEALM